jgi:hypothetical protein
VNAPLRPQPDEAILRNMRDNVLPSTQKMFIFGGSKTFFVIQ